MRTVIRNSYTPKLGDYCNTLVVDKETGSQYLFDKDGVWTLLSLDGDEVIAEAVAQANAYTDDVAEGKVDKEVGKGLSENDFTDEDKEKLDSVEAGAQENVIEVVKRNGVALPVTDKTVDVEVPTATSALTNDSGYITNAVDNLVNYYDKDATDELIAEEALTRDAADQDLQEQIDAISSASDVVDVVGTYAELQNYDTSSLSDNDIIKVLSDSTHDDATTYYRWTNNQFTYIGSEGPFYTKGEADATFVPLTRTINGKGLNSDVVLTATDVNALPASTVIPTVNDATLTIQKNGSTVTTFTANSSQNATANIAVPTKVSDITNDLNFVEESDLADVAFSGDYADLTGTPTIPTKTSDLTNDSDFVSDANYVHTDNNFTTTEKNKLAGIAAGAEVNVQSDWNQSNSSADDYIKNKPSIPTATSDLTNDSGFITSAALPTKTSDLTNDSGFITNTVNNLTNYYDQTTINNMFNALPAVPTKTSDLTNDSGFLTTSTLPIATTSTLGVVKIGSGLSIAADGTLSSSALQSVDWADITGKPTNVSYWTNDAGYITSAAIPTKTSDLTNDSGFITSASLPTKTSDLTNDSGFITNSVNNLTNYYTKSQTYTQGEVNSLLNAIVVPTKTSDLTNDGSDGTSTYVEAADLAAVATSGSYNDLSNKPTIGNATLTIQKNGTDVQTFTANATSNKTANIVVPTKTSDITNDSGFLTNTDYATASTGGVVKVGSGLEITNGVLSATGGGTADAVEWDNVLNKPTFATVATSGSYNDLSNKPTIPTVNDATLTITQNGTSVGTFTANASSNKTIALTDTTYSDATTSASGLMSASDKTKLNGIATGAEVNVQSDWSQTTTTADDYIKNKPSIPTKTSDLTNDSGFITTSALSGYLPLTGGTLTGKLTGTQIETGTAADNYFQTQKFRGQGDASSYYHAIDFGYAGHNQVDFYEYGGAWNFWRNTSGTATTDTNNLALGITLNALKNKSYTYTFPDKTGTFALTSDLPTVNNATLTIQRNSTNVATFTANASSNVTANISVPTKTSELTNDSSFVTSSGTVAKADQLTTPRTIAISGGATGTATSFSGANNISIPITDVKDAYVTWGGKVLNGNVTPDDMGCIDEFGHNKLAFLPAECINVAYSTDGGSTWTDYGATNAQKVRFVSTTGTGFLCGGPSATATADNIANLRLRVRIAAQTPAAVQKLYTSARKLLFNVSTSGAGSCKVQFRTRTIANYLSSTETWSTVGTYTVSGYSGWNSIPWQASFGGSTTSQTGQIGELEFIFWSETYGSSGSRKLNIIDMRLIGATNWATPSEMARAGSLFTIDEGQNATFPANVKVTGSLQHGNYTYTLPNKNGTVAMTSDIPSVPTVNNGTLTIQKNGSNVATFTANQSGNSTANITVPTTVAELSDAGNYATNTALDDKQDILTAGDHISISNDTISATGYVHSENPVTAASSTATVTGSMIATGTITADKLASGATIKLTLSTTDIGEGAALAANTLYGVYT